MDGSPVPFPSLSHYNDEASPERRTSSRIPHGRVKSSPSPVKVWLPVFPQARTRPHLRPLDLAASSPPSTPGPFSAKFIMPNSSPSYLSPSRPSPGRTHTSASGSPSRTAHSSLLTPPLTPSSSFNSASASTITDTDFDGDVVPSTPPDGGSPLRWSALNLRKSALNGPRRSVDEAMPGYSTIMAELSARLGGVDLTPRLEKPFSFGDHDTGATGGKMDSNEKKPSRFLVVQGVSRSATHSSLRAAFCHGNEVKAIYLRLLPQYGIILLLYFDPRCALRAKGEFSGKTLAELCGTATSDTEDRSPLRAESVGVSQVKKVVGPCDFVEPTDSSLVVEVAGRVVDPGSIQQLFSSMGELVEFRADDSEEKRQKDCQTFFVEYFDLRDAELAVQQFNNRNILGAYLRVRPSSNIENREPEAQTKDVPELSFPSIANNSSNAFDIDLSSPPLRSAPLREPESPTPKKGMGTDRHLRPRTFSTSEGGMAIPDHLQDMRQCGGQQLPGGPSPSGLFFGDFNHLSGGPSFNANQQRGIGMQPGRRGYAGAAQEEDVFGPHAPSQAYGMPYPDASTPYQFGSYLPYPQYEHGYTAYDELRGYPGNPVQWMPPNISPTDYHHGTPHSGGMSEHSQGRLDTRGRTGYMGDDRNSRQRPSGASFESTASDVDSGSRTVNGDPFATEKGVSEKNQLNISMIESGLDTRTTVMIRNIPNKMSAKDLMAVIDKVCPRRIDFLYLRMDFSNGCNVGYAFVNFITVQDLLLFAKTMLGVKWNMYSSEKALHLSYANYQGKEALVEKFKNSCIMDERSEWRPRIFFSDGPNQGLPEPFPPATHLRRKERSANNRGALFVPGAHHHHGRYFGERAGLHNGPQRGSFQRDSGARF